MRLQWRRFLGVMLTVLGILVLILYFLRVIG